MGEYNDLKKENWRNYDEIITSSLWIIDRRDNKGNHKGDYHGNFIPQIPYQMLVRYTKKGDWILDPFVGSGTSLIEAEKLNRNSIGIDIDSKILEIAKTRLENSKNSKTIIRQGDSANIDIEEILKENQIEDVQFIFYHPPYWDIIEFNSYQGNLSQAESLEEFLKMFESVFDNTIKYLEDGRFYCIVIGDIYKKGEWIPLSSHIIQLILNKKHKLKSVVVKNIGETKAKSGQRQLWRYRSLVNGFYVFEHEYIIIFKKPGK